MNNEDFDFDVPDNDFGNSSSNDYANGRICVDDSNHRRQGCDYARDNHIHNHNHNSNDCEYGFIPMYSDSCFIAYPTRNPMWCYKGGPEPDPAPLPEVQDTGPEPVIVCQPKTATFSQTKSYTTCYRKGATHTTTKSAPPPTSLLSHSLQKRPVIFNRDDGIVLQKPAPTLESICKAMADADNISSRDGSVKTFAASSIGGDRISRESENDGLKAFIAHVVGGDITTSPSSTDGTSVVSFLGHLATLW